MFCTRCGKPIAAGEFCTNCGTRAAAPSPPAVPIAERAGGTDAWPSTRSSASADASVTSGTPLVPATRQQPSASQLAETPSVPLAVRPPTEADAPVRTAAAHERRPRLAVAGMSAAVIVLSIGGALVVYKRSHAQDIPTAVAAIPHRDSTVSKPDSSRAAPRDSAPVATVPTPPPPVPPDPNPHRPLPRGKPRLPSDSSWGFQGGQRRPDDSAPIGGTAPRSAPAPIPLDSSKPASTPPSAASGSQVTLRGAISVTTADQIDWSSNHPGGDAHGSLAQSIAADTQVTVPSGATAHLQIDSSASGALLVQLVGIDYQNKTIVLSCNTDSVAKPQPQSTKPSPAGGIFKLIPHVPRGLVDTLLNRQAGVKGVRIPRDTTMTFRNCTGASAFGRD
jgi:hypothetical protein